MTDSQTPSHQTTERACAETEDYVRDCLRILGQEPDQRVIDGVVAKLVKLTRRWETQNAEA